MKRAPVLLAIVAIAAVGLIVALRGQERQAAKPQGAATTAASTSQPKTLDDRIAFSFSDDAQLQEFAKVWQQRNATMVKMATLQTFWQRDQARMKELTDELLSKFNLDNRKSYAFDPKRRVIVERGPAIPLPTELGPSEPAASTDAPAAPSG